MEINKIKEIMLLCQELGVTKFTTPNLSFEIELKHTQSPTIEEKPEQLTSYDLMLEDPVAYEEEMVRNGRN